jgi:hypothetical protein
MKGSPDHLLRRRKNGEGTMGIEVGGLLGLIILILDVYAIVKVAGSSASAGAKVLWIVLILLLPVFGFLLWLLAGPSKPSYA